MSTTMKKKSTQAHKHVSTLLPLDLVEKIEKVQGEKMFQTFTNTLIYLLKSHDEIKHSDNS